MYIKHPWHGVDPEWDQHHLLGLIEISKGLKSKYEIDKLSGLLKLTLCHYVWFVVMS